MYQRSIVLCLKKIKEDNLLKTR